MALESQEEVEIHNQTGLLRVRTLEKGKYLIRKNHLYNKKKPVDHLFVKTAAQSFS